MMKRHLPPVRKASPRVPRQRRDTVRFLFLLILTTFLSPQCLFAQYEKFRNVSLSQIHPEGWQKTFLLKQRDGLTGHLDTICEPFNKGGWIGSKAELGPPFYKRKNANGEEVLCWEPFEQDGYYYDGVIRCGLLLQDDFLLDKAKKQIFGTIAQASPEGVMGSAIPDRWPHVTFFRAFMAAYEATKDPAILHALEKHYENDKFSLAGCRSIINIEQLVWLYQQTGREKFLRQAVDLYEAQAARGTDRLVNDFDDLKSDARQDIHGCTFEETLKLPVILYMATGDKKYLDAARNGYRKLDEFHMLPDGVPSSEEGLSGKTSLSAHETCDISDFVWAATYMLKATGEVEWADKIERAVLNAGMSCVTKAFDAHQYLATLNQVVSKIGSCQSPIGNPSWNAYSQRQRPWCCTGNVNRFFPIYVGCQWLKGKDDALVKALYGPGNCVHKAGGKSVKLQEDSVFPFSDTIKITVVEGAAAFPLLLRIPTWAKNPTVDVNGVKQEGVESGRFFVLEGEHKAGDVITLNFPKEVQVRPLEMNGVFVDYGPLLFALPIASRTEKVLLNDLMWSGTPADSKDLYGYNMVPDSKWKYVLALDKSANHRIEAVHNPITNPDDPWTTKNAPLEIKMFGLEMTGWTWHYQEFKPFKKEQVQMEPITPPLPPRGCMTMTSRICEKPERITLVPYGSTTLRLAVFPYWDVKDIPSFSENQINYQ